MLFFGFAEAFTLAFRWNKGNLNYLFPLNCEEMTFLERILVFKNCSINAYLFLQTLPGLTHTADENLGVFGR